MTATAENGAAAGASGDETAAASEAGSGARWRVAPQSPQQAAAAAIETGTGALGQQSPQAPSAGPASSARTTAAAARDLIGFSISSIIPPD